MVKKQTLIVIAGVVWCIAGVNILRIGAQAFIPLFSTGELWRPAVTAGLAVLIFAGFFLMFYRIVDKHCARILGYHAEKKSAFCFFDLKGYLLMGSMIALGVGLRVGLKLPDFFFAFFYSGLGTALTVSGVRFILRRIRLQTKKPDSV